MKAFILMLLLCNSNSAGATPVKRYFQDVKLPSQNVLERQTITTPIDATTNAVLTTNAGPTSAAALTISAVTAQPATPRNLTITPTGTTGDVESCVITVNGTNIFNRTISETFTFLANASTATVGNKAFKSVTSIVFPADCESGSFGATWIVGVGAKLGLKRCLANAGDVLHANFDGASETVGTVAASSTAVESNTYTPTGSMDGTKSVVLDFIQNFLCSP